MSDQWQEFRCTCSVDLGDLLKTWTENIDFQFQPERRRQIQQDRRAEQQLQQAAADTENKLCCNFRRVVISGG